MALAPAPPWLDQVLFDLQAPEVAESLSSWEREFLPSISLQYANWKASTSKMPFGTDRQKDALLNMYRRRFPEKMKDLAGYTLFDTP